VILTNKEIFGFDADQFNSDRWIVDEDRVRAMDKYVITVSNSVDVIGSGPIMISFGHSLEQDATNVRAVI
jgi:hypothetical protein